MRRIINTIFLLMIAGLVNAQARNDQGFGIHFENQHTWQQVLAKAKQERKYIFVDCYATWCGPCKSMDQNVYPLKEVGDIYNKDFISVKLQMDETKGDGERVRSWYPNAVSFAHDYTVTAYPTFLFFDPEGNPVHKKVGAPDVQGFIQLAADARNPKAQYYTVLKNFKPGQADTSEEKGLAYLFFQSDKGLSGRIAVDYLRRIPKTAYGSMKNLNFIDDFQYDPNVASLGIDYLKTLDPKEFANVWKMGLFTSYAANFPKVHEMAIAYILGLNQERMILQYNLNLISAFKDDPKVKELLIAYINKLPEDQLYIKQNIGYLQLFTKSTSDRGFNIFYKHGDKVDKSMAQKGLAQSQAETIIASEEYKPFLIKAKEALLAPDFKTIQTGIAKKYNNDYAERIITYQTQKWYEYLTYEKNLDQYWPDLIRTRIAYIEKFRIDTAAGSINYLNTVAYSDIFLHSKDINDIKAASGWMGKVIQRNQRAEFLDTQASLLYALGEKDNAIAMEQRALNASPRNNEIAKTLADMKQDKFTWPVQSVAR